MKGGIGLKPEIIRSLSLLVLSDISRKLYKTVSEFYENSYICDIVLESRFKQIFYKLQQIWNKSKNYDNLEVQYRNFR